MANSHFAPAPGNFGETYIVTSRTLPTTTIGASSTVRHYLALPASAVSGFPNLFYFKDASLVVGGSATSSFAGTVTARIVKRNSAGTITAMSASTTIATGITLGGTVDMTLSSSISDTDRTVRPNSGDTVAVEITASSTVTTQPADVQAAIRFTVLR